MVTVTDGARRGKLTFGERVADDMPGCGSWQRFLRHHTAIGERFADVLAVAQRAVVRFDGWVSRLTQEEAVCEELRAWRASRPPVQPPRRRVAFFPVVMNY